MKKNQPNSDVYWHWWCVCDTLQGSRPKSFLVFDESFETILNNSLPDTTSTHKKMMNTSPTSLGNMIDCRRYNVQNVLLILHSLRSYPINQYISLSHKQFVPQNKTKALHTMKYIACIQLLSVVWSIDASVHKAGNLRRGTVLDGTSEEPQPTTAELCGSK